MNRSLRVEDASVPVEYRVYAETPLREVIDLMVRRSLHALPVVGSDYEVLGIITTGDALRTLLKGGGATGQDEGDMAILARDVMTRTVLCVPEDQLLTEAAQMMGNRDVEQLPVVRDGALVGLLNRDAVLRVLHGPPGDLSGHSNSDQDT